MLNFGSPLTILISFYSIFIGGELLARLYLNTIPPGISTFLIDHLVVFSVAFFALFATNLIKLKIGFIHKEKGINLTKTSCDRTAYFAIISMALLLFAGLLGGQAPWSDPLGFRQEIQGGGKSYFLVLFLFSLKIYGCCFFWLKYTNQINKKHYAAAAILIIFCLSSGFTSLFIYFFLAGFIYLSARYMKKIITPSVIILFVTLIVITPFYTVFRESLKYQNFNWEIFSDYINRNPDGILSILVDRFDYFDNFFQASEVMRNHADFSYIFNFFYQPLPRSIFPNKPFNFSTQATQWIYPENLDIGVTANFGFVAEFILYFGDFGIIFAAFFFSLILITAYQYYKSSKKFDSTAIFYSVIIHNYFGSFPIGYINDMGLPILIINIILWLYYKKIILKSKIN